MKWEHGLMACAIWMAAGSLIRTNAMLSISMIIIGYGVWMLGIRKS